MTDTSEDLEPRQRFVDPTLDRVYQLLNRGSAIEALDKLRDGLKEAQSAKRTPLAEISGDVPFALGFDTNALFRLGLSGDLGANAVDYLSARHVGPIIIPGQVVQEVWNNALSGVLPSAKRIKSAIDTLMKELQRVDRSLGPSSERAIDAIQEFATSHGDWIDPPSHEIFLRTIESLAVRATTLYVPREPFSILARVRNDTKTPPGYEDPDNNHGDFFVWADFLYSLGSVDLTGVSRVVFVTQDQKPDWSRGGVAHPLLVAEAEALTGVPFEMCSLAEFHSLVKRLVS